MATLTSLKRKDEAIIPIEVRNGNSSVKSNKSDLHTPQGFFTAARNRDEESLKEILEKRYTNFDINAKDKNDNDNGALHLILKGCHCADCAKKVENCLRLLLQNGADANLENYNGKIPLHFAVKYMIPIHLAKLLVEFGATTLDSKKNLRAPLARQLALKIPEVAVAILDKAVTFSPKSQLQSSEIIELNWRYIISREKKKLGRAWVETKHLNDLLREKEGGRKIIFDHPLVKTFLSMKKAHHYILFVPVYAIFTATVFLWYMFFTWKLYNEDCVYHPPNITDSSYSSTTPSSLFFNNNGESNSTLKFLIGLWTRNSRATPSEEDDSRGIGCTIGSSQMAQGIIIIILYCFPLWLEWRKLRVEGVRLYFSSWKNYIFILATVSLFLTLSPVLTLKTDYILNWEYSAAALGMLIGPIFILIQMAAINPFVALYTEMLFKIFWRIVLATSVFSPLLLGFYFSLRMLMTSNHIWAFQMFTMIVGSSESDYESLKDSGRGLWYDIAAYIIFAGFIMLLVVVMVNFLLGLAISDIQMLRQSAKTTRLEGQIRSCYLADVAYGDIFTFWVAITGDDGSKMQRELRPLKRSRDEAHYTTQISEEKRSRDERLQDKFVSKKVRLQLLELARKSRCGRFTKDENENDGTPC